MMTGQVKVTLESSLVGAANGVIKYFSAKIALKKYSSLEKYIAIFSISGKIKQLRF